MALKNSDRLFTTDGWPDDDIVQHGDLTVACFNKLLICQMLIFLSGVSRPHLLLIFLLEETDSLLHLLIDMLQVLAIVGLHRQLLNVECLPSGHGWHDHIFRSRCILWIVKVDPEVRQILLSAYRRILDHSQVENSVIDLLFTPIGQYWDY